MLRGCGEPGSDALGTLDPARTLSVWWGAHGTPPINTDQGGLPGGEGQGVRALVASSPGSFLPP